ncbi:ornithine cyclodeaminase family protein [Piscinibacter sakaiensis]|uniref:Ornithine cyclodeaminase n=1 Tax=Piscinibacter sakaiensis TaxID=1547922 RepID=A0A0K8P8P2_PISS1|nr:ornithine cyclodeaminase family protein [Piscinibacter sakaiensis]GAP39012.1 ornithine cyclodeaminase [Piscinibacter sakaiensis]
MNARPPVPAPRWFDAAAVDAGLPWAALIDALGRALAQSDAEVPPRLHLHVPVPAGPVPPPVAAPGAAPVLLVMPALSPTLGIGTKVVGVYPGNAARGLASIQGLYLLMDAADGQPRAVIDGPALTTRRTAAASALASRALSRPGSRCLLMVGTGRLAAALPRAHAAVRPLERVLVWGRDPARAAATVQALRRPEGGQPGLAADVAASLQAALDEADIVSCATLAQAPLLHGAALRPGTHVDLVGAFTPAMREADAEVFRRAAAVWCDTREGALREAGDIVQAIAEGGFAPQRLAGELARLCRVPAPPRGDGDITVYKSVGMALQDLAAARCLVDGAARGAPPVEPAAAGPS